MDRFHQSGALPTVHEGPRPGSGAQCSTSCWGNCGHSPARLEAPPSEAVVWRTLAGGVQQRNCKPKLHRAAGSDCAAGLMTEFWRLFSA